MNLSKATTLQVKQTFEGLELFGIETRNKYKVLNQEGFQVGYIIEKSEGTVGNILRIFMGHWRKFDIDIFDENKKLSFKAHHPFRFVFQALKITDNEGNFLGRIEQRFSLFSKKFDVVNPKGEMLIEMRSPLLKFWIFTFFKKNLTAKRKTRVPLLLFIKLIKPMSSIRPLQGVLRLDLTPQWCRGDPWRSRDSRHLHLL